MAHKAGNFCWTELMTTDVAKAKPFYAAVLGWTYKDVPMPGGAGTYTMPQVAGADAGGMSTIGPQQKGMPPNWGIYVAVADVDATLKKATELGAKTIAPAFDIPDVGRMAVIQDPTGAVISLWWKDGKHTGFGAGEKWAENPGAFSWGELMSSNVDKAKSFYTKLFGWKTGGDPSYTEWMNGDAHIGGLMPIPKEAKGMPSAWLPYFTVKDTKATAEIAKKNGGKILNGPMTMEGVGIFATIQDPQGAVFQLYQSARSGKHGGEEKAAKQDKPKAKKK